MWIIHANSIGSAIADRMYYTNDINLINILGYRYRVEEKLINDYTELAELERTDIVKEVNCEEGYDIPLVVTTVDFIINTTYDRNSITVHDTYGYLNLVITQSIEDDDFKYVDVLNKQLSTYTNLELEYYERLNLLEAIVTTELPDLKLNSYLYA